jgi:CRP-like cAMP-binding protein
MRPGTRREAGQDERHRLADEEMKPEERDAASAQPMIAAAESRLQRLREVIERRARLGLDTSDGWRLFELISVSIAHVRQSARMVESLCATRQAPSPAARRGGTSVEAISFGPGTTILASDCESGDCYLMENGIASLCFGVPPGVEVGMVGPGGVIGMRALLAPSAVPVAAVATTRCRTLRMPAVEVAARVGADMRALRLLHASIAAQWAESMVLARCNAEHSIRERVARWLLSATRHLRGPIGPISHDRIASLLAVRRASVTVALHELEGEGAIVSRRNLVEVRDEAVLERLSCDCHRLLADRPAWERNSQQNVFLS